MLLHLHSVLPCISSCDSLALVSKCYKHPTTIFPSQLSCWLRPSHQSFDFCKGLVKSLYYFVFAIILK